MKSIVLYDHQVQSIEALRENIRRGIKNQVLAAPTGSGKTVCATHLMDECYDKTKRAVFVADRITLIDQTSAMLDEYEIPHGVIQGNHWRWQPHQRIQVASAATLEKRGWPDADLIIVDECHGIRKNVVERISKRDCITIGLTATPFTRGLGKVYDGIVTIVTTNKLIEQKFLSPYRIFAASEPDMTGAKIVAGEWTDEAAAERAMPIIGDCVAEYLRHGENKKFIAFGVNVAHCTEMQKQFLAAGVPCALYTYREEDAARTDAVAEFRSPQSYLRGLISVAALSKGFDVPDVEVIIMARPLRSSLSEHIQILGRGLRADPANPGKVCTILDHAGNCLRFWHDMQDFFENGTNALDMGKRREKKKVEAREIDPIKCPKCFAVHNPMPLCPACGFVYPARAPIVHQAGELFKLENARAATREEKQLFYSALLWIAHDRHYNPGWVAHKFKAKFGVWPRGLIDAPREPDSAILRWIKSQQIRYAKRRIK